MTTTRGLFHHVVASGNLDQVVRNNYLKVIDSRVRGGVREVASVVGSPCTPFNVLADLMELAHAEAILASSSRPTPAVVPV
jgi:diaminopimelate decarboxylase